MSNKIDYKIFVPRGENNYVRFNTNKEFKLDCISAINIYLLEDKVSYWFYLNIPNDDEHHKFLLRKGMGKGKKLKLILLIGSSPYEIIGESEVIDYSYNNTNETIETKILFEVNEASNTVNNNRTFPQEEEVDRCELIDIRSD